MFNIVRIFSQDILEMSQYLPDMFVFADCNTM